MKVTKSMKANRAARAPSMMPYETRSAKKAVENGTVRSMRKDGPVQQHIIKRREGDECRKLLSGGHGFEKTPATFLLCCATVASRIIFKNWLFKKDKGKSPNEDFSVQVLDAANKLAEGAKRNMM